jgi:hypothetical protein
MALDVEVENTTSTDLDVATSFEAFRDDGKAVGKRTISVLSRLLPAHLGTSIAPGLSSDLGDGYYYVKLTTAWVGAAEEGTTAAYLYFQIAQGRIDVLSETEWMEASAQNVGVAG